MKRPCSISLTGCPGVDSPITNISAEAPDPLVFWGQIWNPYDPYRPPRLDDGPDVRVDCDDTFHEIFSIYEPIVYAGTQLMANLQALAIQLGCPWPTVPPGQIFENDAQTATVYCPDGAAFTYTVEAGTIVSPELDAILGAAWVVWANAWAASYALEQASALRSCIENPPTGGDQPDNPPGDNPPIPTTPPSGGLLPNSVWLCKDDELFRTYQISGNNFTTFSITIVDGSIPPGTTFTQTGPRKAVISGFPSVPGEYQFKIRAVSVAAPLITSEVWATIFVFGISNSSSLPSSQIGIPYSEPLIGIGGTSPYTFALDSGSSMPDGLILSSNGTISGTPTVIDDFTFDVVITDSNGGQCIDTVSFPVTGFSGCGALPSSIADIVWTITGTNGTTITASMAGGSGALSCQFTQTSPLPPPYGTDDFTTHNILFDCVFCNPTPLPIPITFSLPYVSTGGFYGPPAPGAYASIFIMINGVPGVPSALADFTTDLPNPLVATHIIPAMSTVNLQLGFFMTGLAVGFLKVNTTGPMTLT